VCCWGALRACGRERVENREYTYALIATTRITACDVASLQASVPQAAEGFHVREWSAAITWV
jgi:hypothetical protein